MSYNNLLTDKRFYYLLILVFLHLFKIMFYGFIYYNIHLKKVND